MKKPGDVTLERLDERADNSDARIERLEEIIEALRERISTLESHRCYDGRAQ